MHSLTDSRANAFGSVQVQRTSLDAHSGQSGRDFCRFRGIHESAKVRCTFDLTQMQLPCYRFQGCYKVGVGARHSRRSPGDSTDSRAAKGFLRGKRTLEMPRPYHVNRLCSNRVPTQPALPASVGVQGGRSQVATGNPTRWQITSISRISPVVVQWAGPRGTRSSASGIAPRGHDWGGSDHGPCTLPQHPAPWDKPRLEGGAR
jgi:hypothetical protein